MNHNHTRTFIASSELYSGFRVNIDIRYVNTFDDIVKIFLDEMKLVLKQNQMISKSGTLLDSWKLLLL